MIAQIRRQVAAGYGDDSVRLGVGDDAAVVAPTPGHDLVVCTDSIVVDRHFHGDWPAAGIGHLALAVNLSDLAAMAARPRWLVLAMTLPEADLDWLQQCVQGLLALATAHHCQLIGGNLARGPMNLTVTVIGEVASGRAVSRRGAQPGDRVLVSGTLGDCAAAVALGDAAEPFLQQRWRRPLPRVALGQALQPYATAMIDISDGLLADLSHLLGESLGADLEVDRLPTSDALLAAVPERDARQRLQQTGGSDYELLLSVPPDQVAAAQAAADALQTPLTVIGEVATEPGIRPPCDASGWDHFRE